MLGCVSLLGGSTKCVERLVPEAVEVLSDGGQARLVDRVDPTRTLGSVRHEPGVLQHTEVLGHGWPADRKRAGDLDDRKRALGDALEDRTAGGIAKSVELPVRLVSHHEP